MDLNKIDGCENNRWCGALMVNDAEINPLAYDWNAVFLYYWYVCKNSIAEKDLLLPWRVVFV